MSVAVVDKGSVETETPEMRKKREATVAGSPKAMPFRLRAELMKKGRSNQVVAETDHMKVNLKVYASGGENGLHNHTDEDHFHLVLQGSARFYGPRGETLDCGQYEGIMLPSGSFYRFEATSSEPLVLLRVGCDTPPTHPVARLNVYGDPLPSESKENGRVEVVPDTGKFWGAAEKKK
ncbi:MAG TPA: cupin domain-containing protein [Alphaproteobacteria bacterium]|jgi:mannose-6-phosphate isomerase-like protein (cupin superfamily)|nr:cupin domain-containing protein [Alphaproteobacteria bacterium]